jgi:hypothetical protein
MVHEVQAVNAFFWILNSSVNNIDNPETIDATIHAIRHMLMEITGLSERRLIDKEEIDTEEQDSISRTKTSTLSNQQP